MNFLALREYFCLIRNLNMHKLDSSGGGGDLKDDLNDDRFNWYWVIVM